MQISRRDALAGAAAVAAAPLLGSTPGRAAAPAADKQAPSFYRYKVGDIQVTLSPTAPIRFRSPTASW